MKFLRWKKNKLKLLGLTVFKYRENNGVIAYYIFNILIWKNVTELYPLISKIKKNDNFDMKNIDSDISKFAPKEIKIHGTNHNNVGYLVTRLYDTGGHSKCVKDLVYALSTYYNGSLFIINSLDTSLDAPDTLSFISKYINIQGVDVKLKTWATDVDLLFQKIVNFSPRVIFSYIHPDDVFGGMLLYMIHKYTDCKIFYCPHASHFPNVGMSFADIVLESLPTTAYITQKFRKIAKTYTFGVLSKSKDYFSSYSKEEIGKQRIELGINRNELCTMSGGASYKFFDGPRDSDYFYMIRELLESDIRIHHIIISNFSYKQIELIDKIFKGKSSRQRLRFYPLSNKYELLFSAADVFIDSFPISSALTMIDLMRLKVPAVVKINRENAIWSFHEYQKNDYPYMFDNIQDMLNGIKFLLENPSIRSKVANDNFQYYMEHYEGSVCAKKICDLIDNSENLELFYDKLLGSVHYKFKGIYL